MRRIVAFVVLVCLITQVLTKPQGWNIAEIVRDAAIGAETGVLAGAARGDDPGQLAMDAYIGGETGALIGERRGGYGRYG
jgi:hypothetical protein